MPRLLKTHWPLLPLLLFAAALRLYALDRHPLWTDELFSLQSSSGRGFWVEQLPRGVLMDPAPDVTSLKTAGIGSWRGIYWGQSTDTNPPGYYILLRFWREAFGDAAGPVRGISVIAGTAVVGLLYGIGHLGRGTWGGVLGGLLGAIAAQQVAYSQEARAYMPAGACVLTAALAVLWVRRDGWTLGRGVAMGVSAVAAVWMLYLAAVPLVVLAVYAALELRGRDRRNVLLTAAFAGVVIAATLGPLYAEQRQSVTNRNKWLETESRPVGQVLNDTAVAVMTQIAPVQERSTVYAYLAAGLLAVGAWPLYRRVPESRLWLLWVFASFGVLAVWDLAASKVHLQQNRYTLLAGFGVLAIVPLLLPKKRGLGRVVPWAFVVLAGLSTSAAYRVPKEEWFIVRDFARRGEALPGRTPWVVVAYGGRRWDHILYMGLCRYGLSEGRRDPVAIFDDPGQDVAAVREAARRAGAVRIFAEHGSDPTPLIPEGWRRTGLMNFPSVGTLMTYEGDAGVGAGRPDGK